MIILFTITMFLAVYCGVKVHVYAIRCAVEEGFIQKVIIMFIMLNVWGAISDTLIVLTLLR